MIRALAVTEINIEIIAPFGTRIICVVPDDGDVSALQAAHKAFSLMAKANIKRKPPNLPSEKVNRNCEV